MEITFREITKDEVDDIIKHMILFYEHENIPFYENDAKKALIFLLEDSDKGKIFRIIKDGLAVGYLVITFGYSLEFKGKDAFIDELFIDENYRGKGIGTEALKFAEKVCKNFNIKALHLEVERENIKAQNVYRKSGFKDHDRYLMTKWIR